MKERIKIVITRAVITCCLISFFTISFAAQQPNHQQPSKLYLERIPADQLDSFVNKVVLYKVDKYMYQNVILGEKVEGTDYCKIYTDESKSMGIVCPKSQLYKRNSQDCIPKK